MAAAGKPISREFHSAGPPDAVVRDIVSQAREFSRFGYRVESHTATTVVLARRFTPTFAYGAPLMVAALAFLIPVVSPNATTQQAGTGGRIALFAVIAAVILSVIVKTTERLTFSASADAGGSRVLVSGVAISAIGNWVEQLGGAAANATPDEGLPRDSADQAPGWYADPDDPAQHRFWDGMSWTENRHRSRRLRGLWGSWFGAPEAGSARGPEGD